MELVKAQSAITSAAQDAQDAISASLAAQEAIDYLTKGKKRIIFGEKIEKKRSKIKIKYLLFMFILFLSFIPLFLIEKQYEIKGNVFINGKLITEQKINFIDQDKKINYTLLDERGNFEIKLKKENYKIYFEKDLPTKYLEPETSPFSIILNRDLENIRIYVK